MNTTIRLPYTKPPLSLNDRGMSRGAAMAKATKIRKMREQMVQLAQIARLPKGVKFVTVQLHYRPRDNRARDTDNLVATLKPLADGLTAPRVVKTKRGINTHPGHGMVPDDSTRYMSKPEPLIHEAIKGQPGTLWLELTWDT
ncbi:hypothetical protein [Rhodococcus globerulus]|uniref:hypothetical protein n=1 Tax=Rhodococcus globerulus TaxID=33008 RepID=UPI0027A718D1